MRRSIFYTVLLLTVATTSCHRQRLVSPYDSRVEIPINVDWSLSGLPDGYANNMSIYFYPDTGGAPFIKVSGSITSSSVRLPAGRYSVLIFNDFVDDFNGIEFEDEDSYADISAAAHVDANIASSIDRMAAWRLDEFEIIYDNECGYCCDLEIGEGVEVSASLLGLQPTPVTAQNTITLRVENLNNAQSITGILYGEVTSATLATNDRVDSDGDDGYKVSFASRTYDDTSDPTDGVTSTTLTTFGKQLITAATYKLVIDVILNSGETMSFTRDVTDQVVASDDFNIVINLTDAANLISLPESSGTGFGVEQWGDNEDLNLL